MSDSFDPYYEWLGIAPDEQPPHCYRLLGINALENNSNVIANAADQRMAHVRTFQGGKRSAQSQKLLNELAAAKVCLLNPAKKAAYDRELRKRLEARNQADGAVANDLDPAIAELAASFQRVSLTQGPQGRKMSPPKPLALFAALGALAVVAVGLTLWFALGSGGPPNNDGPAPIVAAHAGQPSKADRRETPRTPETKSVTVADRDSAEMPKPKDSAAVPQFEARTPAAREKLSVPAEQDVTAEASPARGPAGATAPSAIEAAEKPPREPESAPVKTLAPPSADEQKPLIVTIDEVYEVGKAKDAAAKLAIARKLLEAGRANESNRSEQFVLFRRASELAVDAREPDLMLEAVDAIAEAGFDIRPLSLKGAFFVILLKLKEPLSKEEVHRTSPLQGRFPASSADRLRVLDAPLRRHGIIPSSFRLAV